jgi:hypothetical protein
MNILIAVLTMIHGQVIYFMEALIVICLVKVLKGVVK